MNLIPNIGFINQPPTLAVRVIAFLVFLLPGLLNAAQLNTRLLDALSGAGIAGVTVAAFEVDAAGQESFNDWGVTDAQGRVVLDLAGLDNGSRFVLKANPLDSVWMNSTIITQPGDFDFSVGNLEVTLINGGNGTPIAAGNVGAMERLSDGTDVWLEEGTTNGEGNIRFHLPGLGTERVYFLYTENPVDGSFTVSGNLTQPGWFDFSVGNGPLSVTVVNGITALPVAGVDVHAFEQTANGDLIWLKQGITDGSGRLLLDLDGLGSGRRFALGASPYDGLWVMSEGITESGAFEFRVGNNLEVTAVDGIDGSILSGVTVGAFERLADGTETYRTTGITDSQGIIRFSLPGLGSGRTYKLYAIYPDAVYEVSEYLTQGGGFHV